jgi:Cu(I)/Ag(I) efflux system membrane protein CusA/SilA
MDGALLRLRPKVMTVSTVIAALLPIMWSTRVGAEVMKPLAAPVLGGMVSSLLHVLVVTPVIFYALRARQLRSVAPTFRLRAERSGETRRSPEGSTIDVGAEAVRSASTDPHTARKGRFVWIGLGVAGVIAIIAFATWKPAVSRSAESRTSGAETDVVQKVRAADLEILLLSPAGTLRTGRNTFTIEFRNALNGSLEDVGTVSAAANMTMPGMAMSGDLRVTKTNLPGRYEATAAFAMAGAWLMSLQWDGPAGQGSVTFQGDVQ